MAKKSEKRNLLGNESGAGKIGLSLNILLFLIVGVVFIGGFWLGSFVVSDRIIYGVHYRGLDLSGLTRPVAENIIARDAQPAFKKNALVLVYEKDFWQISPADIDLALDARATISRALAIGRNGGFLGNIATVFRAAFYGVRISAVVTYDEEKFLACLRPIEDKISQPLEDAVIDIDDNGLILRKHSVIGRGLGDDAWRKMLDEKLATLNFPQRINVEPIETVPKVKDDDLTAVDTVLGNFSVYCTEKAAQRDYVAKAVNLLDKKLVLAGEKLSLNNDVINARPDIRGNVSLKTTAEESKSISPEEAYAYDLVASALYGASLKAGLKIISREAGDGDMPLAGVTPGFTAIAHGGRRIQTENRTKEGSDAQENADLSLKDNDMEQKDDFAKADLVIKNSLDHNIYILAKARGDRISVDVLGASADHAGANIKVMVEKTLDPLDEEYEVIKVKRQYVHGNDVIWSELVAEDKIKITAVKRG